MKTAISVPDATFARVEKLASQHGLNRSQFFTLAAGHYADQLESAALTSQIDTVLGQAEGQGENQASDRDLGNDQEFLHGAATGILSRDLENEQW